MGGFILAEARVSFLLFFFCFFFFFFLVKCVGDLEKEDASVGFCVSCTMSFCLCFNDFHDFRCFDKAYLVLRKHRESPLRELKLQLRYTTPRFLESLCVIAFILSRRSSPFF